MIDAYAVFTLLADYFSEEQIPKDAEHQALDFLRAFSGTSLRFPLMTDIERLARERSIVQGLDKDPSLSTVRRLQDRFGLPKRNIGKAYAKFGEGLRARRARAEKEER